MTRAVHEALQRDRERLAPPPEPRPETVAFLTPLDAEAVFGDIGRALQQFGIGIVELTPAMVLAAPQAHGRYGKGRGHPARLNTGDCLSYGAARTLGLPLLCKGEDFARTDIASALAP